MQGAGAAARQEAQRRVDRLEWVQGETAELSDQLKAKEALRTQLQADVQAMHVDKNRQYYTQRLLDNINSITKQKQEISKVFRA